MRSGGVREQKQQERGEESKHCNCFDCAVLAALSHGCFCLRLSIAGASVPRISYYVSLFTMAAVLRVFSCYALNCKVL